MDEIIISEQEINEFLFAMLLKMGYAPTDDEVADIAAIFFDYMVQVGIISDIEYENE